MPCSLHEFHETCHSVTFIVLVNSHQRLKQTLWRFGVTASFGVFFHEVISNGMTSFMELMRCKNDQFRQWDIEYWRKSCWYFLGNWKKNVTFYYSFSRLLQKKFGSIMFLSFLVLGSNPGWAGPSSSCHLILVCVNYDLYGSLHINSRLHARLNNQISHPIPSCRSRLKQDSDDSRDPL